MGIQPQSDLLEKLKKANPNLYTLFVVLFILLNIVTAIIGLTSQQTLPFFSSIILLLFILTMISILGEKDGFTSVFKWACMLLTIFIFLLFAIYLIYLLYLQIFEPIISQDDFRKSITKITYVDHSDHFIERKSGTEATWIETNPGQPENKAELLEGAQDPSYLMMSRPSSDDQRIYVRIPLCGGSVEWTENKLRPEDGDIQSNCKDNACWGSVGKVHLSSKQTACRLRRDLLGSP